MRQAPVIGGLYFDQVEPDLWQIGLEAVVGLETGQDGSVLGGNVGIEPGTGQVDTEVLERTVIGRVGCEKHFGFGLVGLAEEGVDEEVEQDGAHIKARRIY